MFTRREVRGIDSGDGPDNNDEVEIIPPEKRADEPMKMIFFRIFLRTISPIATSQRESLAPYLEDESSDWAESGHGRR